MTEVNILKTCRVISAALQYLTCSAKHINNFASAVEYVRMGRTSIPCLRVFYSYSLLSGKTQMPKINKILFSSSFQHLETFKTAPTCRSILSLVPMLTLLIHTLGRIKTEFKNIAVSCIPAFASVGEGKRLMANVISRVLKPFRGLSWMNSREGKEVCQVDL